MPSRYASSTDVSSDRSRTEIERTLNRYDARQFMYGLDENHGMVAFTMRGRQIRFVLPMPARDSREIVRTPTGLTRSPSAQKVAYDQAVRQRWRALLLVIKAKLEAVESGIVSFEEEFLAQIVLPNNRTVGQEITPGIAQAYETNQMPALLPAYPALEA